MDAAKEKRKPRKRLRVSGVVLLVLAAAAAALLVLRLAGVQIYVMASASMEKALFVGDLVVVAPKSYDRIQPGDIITFAADSSGQTETHRVISKNEESQSFVTKGDRNAAPDESEVSISDVVGKVCFSLPGIGYVAIFLATLQGKIFLGLLFAIFVVTVLLVSLCRGRRRSSAS